MRYSTGNYYYDFFFFLICIQLETFKPTKDLGHVLMTKDFVTNCKYFIV